MLNVFDLPGSTPGPPLDWVSMPRPWVGRRLVLVVVTAIALLSASSGALGLKGLPAHAAPAPTATMLRLRTVAETPTAALPPSVTSTAATVIIGDSHAWLWSMRVPTLPDLGVPGATTSQIAEQIPDALAMHPHYVVISAGTNDLNEGKSWTSVVAALATMVGEVKSGGATPILLLLPQFGGTMQLSIWEQLQLLPAGPATKTLQGADEVPLVNNAIRQMGVPVLEAPAGETVDGIHLNDQAYDSLGKQLAAITG